MRESRSEALLDCYAGNLADALGNMPRRYVVEIHTKCHGCAHYLPTRNFGYLNLIQGQRDSAQLELLRLLKLI